MNLFQEVSITGLLSWTLGTNLNTLNNVPYSISDLFSFLVSSVDSLWNDKKSKDHTNEECEKE